MVCIYQSRHGDSRARDRNPRLECSLDLGQRLSFRFDHVEETYNGRGRSAAAEKKIGTWHALVKENWADKGDDKIANPIGA